MNDYIIVTFIIINCSMINNVMINYIMINYILINYKQSGTNDVLHNILLNLHEEIPCDSYNSNLVFIKRKWSVLSVLSVLSFPAQR